MKVVELRYLWIVGAAVVIGVGCSKQQFSSIPVVSKATRDGQPAIPAVPGSSQPPPVCDPFGGPSIASGTQGLVAHGINYIKMDQLGPNDPDKIINNSVEGFFSGNALVGYLAPDIFLTSIDFPNIFFSLGFVDSRGDILKNSDGNPLVQYFAFRAESAFVAANWTTPGDYEIATLTDDGSILTMSGAQNDGSDLVVNNDGVHSLRMGCSSQILHMTANSQIPLRFDYYQGPPTTIGLMMLYRPVTDMQEPLCGKGGNSDGYFFLDKDQSGNPISPPQPQAPYLQLTSQFNPSTGSGGWKVVEMEHFQLPANVQNPCAPVN